MDREPEPYDYKEVQADLKPIIDKGRDTWFLPEYQEGTKDSEVLGVAISKYFEWNIKPIVHTFLDALEDSNAHTLRAKIEALL